ncbi:nitronate monooxygenase [bacterium]|nr:nitronate monooxygenase [bacterium]
MNFKTKVTELLNIEYPIVEGGMVWAGGVKLAISVSEAGCLGTLGGGAFSDEESLISSIQTIKSSTIKPFALNIPMIYSHADMLVEIAIAQSVPIVITSGGDPSKYTNYLKKNGIITLHVISTVGQSLKAINAGVDAVICEGSEAGGHNGRDEITTISLIPQIAKKISIPIIAAGGIATGEQMLASFVLGADAVQIGTLFASSEESSAHPNYKKMIIESEDTSTIMTSRRNSPVRVLKNSFSKKMINWDYSNLSKEEINDKIGRGRSMQGILMGDIDNGILLAGQSSALIQRVEPVSQQINNLIKEMIQSFDRIKHYFN